MNVLTSRSNPTAERARRRIGRRVRAGALALLVLLAVTAASLPSADAAPARTAAPPGAPVDPTQFLIDHILDYAKQKGGPEFGWLVDLVQDKSQDPAFVKKMVDQMNSRFDAVDAQLSAIRRQLDTMMAEIKQQLTDIENRQLQQSYDLLSGPISSGLANMKYYFQWFDRLTKRTPGTPLDGTDLDNLVALRRDMPVLIEQIEEIAKPETMAKTSIFSPYRTLAWRHLPWYVAGTTGGPTVPNAGMGRDETLVPNEMVDTMYQLIGFLQVTEAKALYLLAESFHVTFDHSGNHYRVDTATVEAYANKVVADRTTWIRFAAYGLGRLPANTLADTRSGTLWTRSEQHPPASEKNGEVGWDKGWITYARKPETMSYGPRIKDPQVAIENWATSATVDGVGGWQLPNSYNAWASLTNGSRNPADWLRKQDANLFPDNANSAPFWQRSESTIGGFTVLHAIGLDWSGHNIQGGSPGNDFNKATGRPVASFSGRVELVKPAPRV